MDLDSIIEGWMKRVAALEREREVLSEGFDGSERLRIALERDNARLRAALERITVTREDWAPDIAREALEPPVEGGQ